MEYELNLDEQMDYAAVSLELLRHMRYFKEMEQKLYTALEESEFHLSKRMDALENDIALTTEVVTAHIFPRSKDEDDEHCCACGAYPDNSGYCYDEPYEEELPPEFFSEQEEKPIDTTLRIDNLTVPITFPNMKMAIEWTNPSLDNLDW